MFKNTAEWIKRDFREHPYRFVAETCAWFGTVGSALTMAMTIPNPPFQITYPIWIAASTTFCWAAWTRGSFGMMANYSVMICIDVIGLTNFLLTH